MRGHDWTGFAALGAAVAGLVALARGVPTRALGWFVVAAGAGVVTRYWSRTRPAPMPHLLRWTLRVPRGNQSPEHLKRILEPRTGERVLEIGPGIGIHALPMARALAPDGTVDVLDVQQAMLDDLMRRARAAAITNIVARLGDARRLPYPQGTFDAAGKTFTSEHEDFDPAAGQKIKSKDVPALNLQLRKTGLPLVNIASAAATIQQHWRFGAKGVD